MPKKRIATKRKPKAVPSFDYESADFLTRVEALAFEGYYNTEIADELKISRYELEMAISQCEVLRNTLSEARARAKQAGAERPSLAKFTKIWKECKGKRSVLMKKLGIGWTKFQQWCSEEPGFIDIMAERDIEFLEQADIAGRVLSLGGIQGKDEFPGWSRRPDPWMMRYYFNTIGKRYGYGENTDVFSKANEEEMEMPTKIEHGIDIESWIKQEVSAKSAETENDTEKGGAG